MRRMRILGRMAILMVAAVDRYPLKDGAFNGHGPERGQDELNGC